MDINPKKRKVCTDFDNGRIIDGYLHGKRASLISQELNVPVRTIYNKIKKYIEFGSVQNLPRSGRPKKTTIYEDQLILRAAKVDPFICCRDIASNIGRLDLSPVTIRRRLVKLGCLKCQRASKKPFLSEVNRKIRLQWARDHQNWNRDDWKKVLWSDESKFMVRHQASRKVWRPTGMRYHPKYTSKSVKHQKSVMVWGCFSYYGVGRLYRINGIMKKEHYHRILQHEMIPSARGLYGRSPWIFQQDNDPKHTAHVNKQYLIRKHINILEWPSQSPDLNPIENLWSELDRRLKKRTCNTEDQLFEVLRHGWDQLAPEYLEKLVDSMPSRCRAVIKAKGNGTKY